MLVPSSLVTVHFVGYGALLFFIYSLSLAVYRVFMSPLRKFPGPKLAAATFWYEFYYDVVLGGQYTFHIAKLHERYGPVIRINPYEIHVKTPEFYDILYTGAKHRRNKWRWASGAFGVDLSTFGSELHEVHGLRRSAIAPFFSMARVIKLEPIIQERADAALNRVKQFGKTGGILRLDHLFTACATDIITKYAFGFPRDGVNAPDFDSGFHGACINGCKQVFLTRQFPLLMDLAKMIPGSWILKWNPAIGSYFAMQRDVGIQIRDVLRQDPSERPKAEHPTFFHELLESKLPDHEKTIARLAQESGALLGAGTVTTAWTMTTGVFYLLREPEVLRKLKQELTEAVPPGFQARDKSLLRVLMNLPYLSAVAQESIRMGHGLVSRAARVAPDEDLAVPGTQFVIPRNTPVSMTHFMLNLDPDIFESPLSFRPERWIENPGLSRWQIGFSKGARACSGRDLAMAEIFLILGTIFPRFGTRDVRLERDVGYLELFETDETDVNCSVDALVVQPKKDTKGVRCTVHYW
ncbi:hypothetical protein AAE478_008986 [Parahypoxylon ruwenzoriense]